jgi:hypothetical protein
MKSIGEQLAQWTLVGPWPEGPSSERWKPLPLDAANNLPASAAGLGEGVVIRKVSAGDGKVDLREQLGGMPGTQSQGYAFVELNIPEGGRLDLVFDADYWTMWWLDGREVGATRGGNDGALGEMRHCLKLSLTPGWHLLCARVVGGTVGWKLWSRLAGWNPALSVPSARFSLSLNDLLEPHDMLWSQPRLPADWMNGAPIGNGDFGATVHGAPDNLTFTFGKTNVWQRYEHEADAFPVPFAEFRRICRDRDEEAYRRWVRETIQRQPGKDSHMTTCGSLRLRLNPGYNPKQATMRLRLRDGVMELGYASAKVTAFVSHGYDVLAVEIDRGMNDPGSPCMSAFVPFETLPWELTRPFPDKNHPESPVFSEEAGVHYMTQPVGRGEFYVIGLRVLGFEDTRHSVLPNQLLGQCGRPEGRTVRLLVTIVSSRDAADPRRLCRERFSRAESAGALALLSAQREHWDKFWGNGLAAVADGAVEKFYYRSLYLCGAALRPGCQSPGLQGVWCGELATPWNSDYHSDFNIQAVYWGLFTNNRLELIDPYLRLYAGFADRLRKTTREVFGMRGLRFPLAASLDGEDFTRAQFWGCLYEPAATGWVAQLFWQYFEYSRDLTWLRGTGYPILRDVARYMTDYLQYDPVAGRYVIEPSCHYETGSLEGWGRNAQYAVAFFRVGLAQAIRAAETLGVDATERAEWQERLDHMPDLPMEGGLLKRLEDRPLGAAKLGDVCIIPAVFPAELVSRTHGPPAWRQAAMATWEAIRGHEQDGGWRWLGGMAISAALRLGDVDNAFRMARWPGGEPTMGNTNIMLENGFTIAVAGDYIQVDHGPGMCRVLADMMLLCIDSVVQLFPGIPKQVPARFLSLRTPGGFLLTAEKRGETADYLLVEATVEGEFRLANDWKTQVRIEDTSDGSRVVATSEDVIAVALQPGQRYLMFPESHPPSGLPMVDFAFVAGIGAVETEK